MAIARAQGATNDWLNVGICEASAAGNAMLEAYCYSQSSDRLRYVRNVFVIVVVRPRKFDDGSVDLDQIAGKHNYGAVCSCNRVSCRTPFAKPYFQLHCFG